MEVVYLFTPFCLRTQRNPYVQCIVHGIKIKYCLFFLALLLKSDVVFFFYENNSLIQVFTSQRICCCLPLFYVFIWNTEVKESMQWFPDVCIIRNDFLTLVLETLYWLINRLSSIWSAPKGISTGKLIIFSIIMEFQYWIFFPHTRKWRN